MLVVMGTGINGPAHLTQESRAWIEQADRVLYVVADAVTESYIKKLAPEAVDLKYHYGEGKSRYLTYQGMADSMLEEVRTGKTVVAIFYGHPGVFVAPTHDAIKRARAEGYEAKMLPAISAEDCLVSDLGLDPARQGCLTFEATDFLVNSRPCDARSLLILWQVGVVGNLAHIQEYENPYIGVLQARLLENYPADHEVIVYEAAQFSICEPVIRRIALGSLDQTKLTGISTLVIPPAHPTASSEDVMRKLNISWEQVPEQAVA